MASTAERIWLGWWKAQRRYHRLEVYGLEHLVVREPRLIVAYHGRPIAGDVIMLTTVLHERLGYLPHPITHAYFYENPVLAWMNEGMGAVTIEDGGLQRAIDRGEHIIITPGGTREGCRPVTERHKVNWGGRRGYLKLALRYGLQVVPVAAVGTDNTYIGLNNGDAWSRKLKVPNRVPLWFGVGPLGLWPFSPPFPVKLRSLVGPPMDLLADGPVDPEDRDALDVLHARVSGAVQGLMDRGVPPGATPDWPA